MDLDTEQPMKAGEPAASYDVILIGGGLQNALIALLLVKRAEPLRVLILEQQDELLKDRTLSGHASDIAPEMRAILSDFWRARWPDYQVRFPGRRIQVSSPYQTLDTDKVREALMQAAEQCKVAERVHVMKKAFDQAQLDLTIKLGCTVHSVDSQGRVVFEDKNLARGKCILDSRPPAVAGYYPRMGFQKFLGWEVSFEQPHNIDQPTIMDATVPQQDGYRFLYCLPFDKHTLLIEDTYLQKNPHLDTEQCETTLRAWIDKNAADPASAKIVRKEQGKIPVPYSRLWPDPFRNQRSRWLNGRSKNVIYEALSSQQEVLPCSYLGVGVHRGYLHPATGYSLPLATEVAAGFLCDLRTSRAQGATRIELEHAGVALQRIQSSLKRYYIFNFFLFHTFRRGEAYHSFEYFYEHSLGYIERFYALRLRWLDLAALFIRLPPRRFSYVRFAKACFRLCTGRLKGRVS